MGYSEKRGSGASTYYRGRYKTAPGKYGTVSDSTGATIKFAKAREAKQAADREEAKLAEARRPYVDRRTQPTLAEFVQGWFAGLELAESTLENYRDHIESHLLSAFGDTVLTDITAEKVRVWMAAERAAGYAESSVETYRAMLHLILQDAIEEGVPLDSNPAAKKRGRGRRSGRQGGTAKRPSEKVTTSPLGALLIAERAAVLAGRDDEFVQVIDLFYTQKRWGESIGTTKPYVQGARQRIERQLYQKRDGSWAWCPPKDDSYRWIDIPAFLQDLTREQMRRRPPTACPCHGQATLYVDRRPLPTSTRDDVAAAAGVPRTTVSRVHTAPHLVAAAKRERVLAAEKELGLDQPPRYRPHSDRNDWRHAVWQPAATGWFPTRGQHDPPYPVPVELGNGVEFPGRVLRGRYSGARASSCWAPIATGITPHGARHTGRAWMDLLGTPKVLVDERMGHVDTSVPGIYSHVLPEMRTALMRGLTMLWEQSLADRLRLSPRSAVPTLDRLLAAHRERISQDSPEGIMRRVIQRTNSPSELAFWK